MGGNFCQILELGGTTIKGRRVRDSFPGYYQSLGQYKAPSHMPASPWNTEATWKYELST